MIKKTSADRLAKSLGIPKSRGLEAVLKAQLVAAILREVDRRELTHVELSARSGLPRSAVSSILSGSLQKVTIDRVRRLVEAAGLEADIHLRRSPANARRLQKATADAAARRFVRSPRRGRVTNDDISELTAADFERAIPRRLRDRLVRGEFRGAGDVAAVRRHCGLSQEAFAQALGIGAHTLRNWEQGRRMPKGPALALLRIAARHPRVLRENRALAG